MDITSFVLKLDDLIEDTNGEVSYLELIGALEATKQRLILEFMDDEDDDEDDDGDDD